MKLLGSIRAGVWKNNVKYYVRKRKVFVADELRVTVQTRCAIYPVRFALNIRYLCSVYGIGIAYMNRDSKTMGFTIHVSTLHNMENLGGYVLSLLYCCYVENYFKFRFNCPVTVAEMLGYDLSQYDRYSKRRLNPMQIDYSKFRKVPKEPKKGKTIDNTDTITDI